MDVTGFVLGLQVGLVQLASQCCERLAVDLVSASDRQLRQKPDTARMLKHHRLPLMASLTRTTAA
jgi:hypothetical protein